MLRGYHMWRINGTCWRRIVDASKMENGGVGVVWRRWDSNYGQIIHKATSCCYETNSGIGNGAGTCSLCIKIISNINFNCTGNIQPSIQNQIFTLLTHNPTTSRLPPRQICLCIILRKSPLKFNRPIHDNIRHVEHWVLRSTSTAKGMCTGLTNLD